MSTPELAAQECPSRVAYELMRHIAVCEKPAPDKLNTRDYWLTLYRQCWKATDGRVLKDILESS